MWDFNTCKMFTFCISTSSGHSLGNKPLIGVDRDQGGEAIVALPNHHVESFTVDYAEDTIIVADRTMKQIKQLQLEREGTRQCVLFSGTSSEVLGIAVDWIAKAVYWTDASYDVILVQNYGSCPPSGQPGVLFDSGIDEPTGIVTHPRKGFLFWAEGGRSPRISRSTLSGKGAIQIVERNLRRPSHLTIDLNHDRLYWIDSGSGWLSSCDLHGYHRKRLLRIERAVFGGLAVYQHHAYVTDQRRQAIYVTDLRSGTVRKRLALSNKPCNLITLNGDKQESLREICGNHTCRGPCVNAGNGKSECVCGQTAKRSGNFWDNSKCDDLNMSTFEPSVMYTKRFGIYAIPENFADLDRPATPTHIIYAKNYLPYVIASNVNTGKLFCSERKYNAILRVGLHQESKVRQILLTLGRVESLAVDWVAENLYWTDSSKEAIMVSTQDGRYTQYFIHKEAVTPKYLAIHPGRRKLFWINSMPVMESCYLDGSFRDVIVSDGMMRPTGLVLDIRQERLYWSDEAFGRIVSSNLDGSDRRVIYSRVDSIIKSIAVVKDYLVYSDWHYTSRGLHAVNTKTGHYVGHFAEDGLVYGVHFHHVSIQPLFQNACSHDNGGCHHLCLPNFSNFSCACAFGYRLSEDNRTCETDLAEDKFLLIADQRLGSIYQLDLWRFQFHALPLQSVIQPYSVCFNPEDQKVYWSDVTRGTINRAFMNGSEQEIILAREELSVVKLVVEANAGLLYYLDVSQSLLGVIAVKGLHHKTLIINITEPRDFTVDPEHGLIFVVSNGSILQYGMDGSDVLIHTESSQPTGLSLDMSTNQLYWFDSMRGHILTSGTDVWAQTELVAQIDAHIRALDVDPNYIYWVDSERTSVFRARKSDGESRILLGEESPFFLPVSIFVQRGRMLTNSPCNSDQVCSHLCLPRRDSYVCACPDGTMMKKDGSGCYLEAEERIEPQSEFCVVPKIEFGFSHQQTAGHVVDEGFVIEIACIDGTVINSGHHVTCKNGAWSHTPVCQPARRNPIYGTEARGQRVFTHSGVFVVPHGVDQVDVVCIGGGGGGRDGRSFRDAGDGGRSSFGDMLVAEGGMGGKAVNNSGGLGGKGTVASGGKGRLHEQCGGPGGAAGETTTDSRDFFPGLSSFLYCGGGGTSDPRCLKDYPEAKEIPESRSGPGGENPSGASGGQYGGGSGGSAGGRGGGGGGYSFATIQLNSRREVAITVGQPGSPAFAQPGKGVVVVAWGGKVDPDLRDFTTPKDLPDGPLGVH
ncbi:low-density lipoprotein receptor-related protein 4-like [Liolophura sinensis]|uniref:low-density lipoprotein receptor-related protein 4-like n=1 Tax=Liolophura sinensis TaxID=3198878 RepID=UPI00315807E4